MATKKKMLQAAAGNAGGAGLNVEDVFSTYLYTGNGSTQTITNGIDLDSEGGLVWLKARGGNYNQDHSLIDTERGHTVALGSNLTTGNLTQEYALGTSGSFNSNGFTIASSNNQVNGTSPDVTGYASWTFRKAPKFFDVVSYTGNGVAGREMPHSLGVAPGMIIVKRLDSTGQWFSWHRAFGDVNTYIYLSSTSGSGSSTGIWGNNLPDSNKFELPSHSINASGATYVAYLFAHNDGDGGFGAAGDADIIKCGSYTGGGSSNVSVDLGFEPAFLIVKRSDSPSNWYMFDSMRGWTQEDAQYLRPNTSEAEGSVKTDIVGQDSLELNSTGFTMKSQYNPVNQSGGTYIYIAIRRGTKVPESASEVFDVEKTSGTSSPVITTGFPTDLYAFKTTDVAQGAYWSPRLTNKALISSSTAAETSNFNSFDSNTTVPTSVGSTGYVHYNWKRAPGYFDAVAYSGNSTSGRTVSHNLGVAPEMIWVKNRDTTNDWNVWHSALTATQSLRLNLTNDVENNSWFTASPTDQAFFTNSYQGINASGNDYIAYLFASLDGISKVGSYTGTGSTINNIDCGFTAGTRFVLIKRTDATGDWIVYDAERGITVNTTDEVLRINTANAEATENTLFGGNRMIPRSYGFAVVESDLNASGGTYIFYAIA